MLKDFINVAEIKLYSRRCSGLTSVLEMDPDEDEGDLEDQLEKWLTDDFSLAEFEDEDLSELTDIKDHDQAHDYDDADYDVTANLTNQCSAREWRGCVRSQSLELIDAEETEEEEGAKQKVAEVGGGGGGLVREEVQPLILSLEQGGAGPPTCSVMDKYRPKRPTTLALFPQQPQAGSQDTINNNSLGKKDSWKDSHSSSPHITGDLTPPGAQPKGEAKVRPSTRRPAPKPPVTNGVNSRTNGQAPTATDARARARERPGPAGASTQSPRSQRRGAGGTGVGGKGVGRGAMRERSQGEPKAKDGPTAGKEERRGARLCEEKCRDKDKNGHSRTRETYGLRGRAEAKTKAAPKAPTKGPGGKVNNMLNNHQPYLPAMVVPRTPVAPRKSDKSQEKGQNHDRTQEQPPTLSRSSSEGGSNRMSLSSDTEGPPPGPLHPTLSCRPNPCISEEDGEGEPTPSKSVPVQSPADNKETKPGAENTETVHSNADVTQDPAEGRTLPKSETTAGLNYDSVKYTLVVDEHAQLELVSLKDCLHSYNEHKDDSDTETVYQSANEEEDPEYEEERMRKEQEAKKQDRRNEEDRKRKEEEDLKKRREEEVKRRREVVTTFYRHPKLLSTTTSEEDQSNELKATSSRSKKFLNLFGDDSDYSEKGAGSFGMFSCILNGVERQQSHRAVYRFVPRHADELYLEADDPVLILNQSEDLWCQGYNMRTGATGIFPAFYVVKVAKDINKVQKEKDGWLEQFMVRFLGSVQVPIFKGNDVLCAAMHKVACNRRQAGQPPSACVLEVSVKGVKIIVQDQCQAAHRGDQCFNFFQLKNISFCGCHPKHSRYFGFITKHPDQQRFACHVLMSDTTLHPLAECVGRAFKQYYKENVGYSCPTEDIFIE